MDIYEKLSFDFRTKSYSTTHSTNNSIKYMLWCVENDVTSKTKLFSSSSFFLVYRYAIYCGFNISMVCELLVLVVVTSMVVVAERNCVLAYLPISITHNHTDSSPLLTSVCVCAFVRAWVYVWLYVITWKGRLSFVCIIDGERQRERQSEREREIENERDRLW